MEESIIRLSGENNRTSVSASRNLETEIERENEKRERESGEDSIRKGRHNVMWELKGI